METREDPDLKPEVLEDQVATAMERARTRAGLTVEAMVRRLRPALRMPPAPEGRGVRQNWYDWRQNPRSFPAVALVAAAKLAGQSVDSLLMDSSGPSTAQATRLESLERQVADLTRRLEQRERQDRTVSASEAVGFDLDAWEDTLAVVEERLYDVGRLLGRPWDEPIERDQPRDRADSLRQRIGTLEARLVVLAGMVGAPSGGYPSAPEAANADDEEFREWLRDVIAVVQEQLPGVLERAATFIEVPTKERQASSSSE